jgi:hypothetical protein
MVMNAALAPNLLHNISASTAGNGNAATNQEPSIPLSNGAAGDSVTVEAIVEASLMLLLKMND